jgi:photosystem II stability/assembly factor-like uncharacterized protein
LFKPGEDNTFLINIVILGSIKRIFSQNNGGVMKSNFYFFFILLLICGICSSGMAVDFDELIVAPEVLFDGATPEDFYFRQGRILDENTIWFLGNTNDLFAPCYVFRSVDGGKTFTYNETGIPSKGAQVDAFDANIAVVSTNSGDIYRTTDGGATWTEVYSYDNGAFFNGLRVLNENVAVANGDGTTNGEMHYVRSTDKGATWTEIEGIDYLGAGYGYTTFGLGACNIGESVWTPATTVNYDSAFIFRSYDAGATWEGFKIPSDIIPRYPRSAGFSDDNNGLISDREGHVVKTTDGGETWTATNMPDTSSSSWVNGIVHIPGTDILLGMDDIGAFYTTDLGATWGEIETPAETDDDYIISGMFLNQDFGYVFTDNGQVLRFENQVTSVPAPYANNTPSEFRLNQNYPNPFNPSTVISWQLSTASEVELTVYNILGSKVATLVRGHQNPGNHAYQFDGSDLASGVYYYQLVAGEFKQVRKMVLIK